MNDDKADDAAADSSHTPVLEPAPFVVDAGVTLWCGRCTSATLHQIGHLPSVELGAPQCVICRRWAGFQCTECGAVGDQRRPKADAPE